MAMQVDHNLSYYDARDVDVRVIETDPIQPMKMDIMLAEDDSPRDGNNLMNEEGFEEIADPKRHGREQRALDFKDVDGRDRSKVDRTLIGVASFDLDNPSNSFKTNKASPIIGRSEPGSFLELAKQLKEQMLPMKCFSAASCPGDFEKSKPPSGEFQSFARENPTWSSHDAHISELKKQVHTSDAQLKFMQNQVQVLTQTLLEKDRIMNEGARYTEKFYLMRDQCMKQEERLRAAQAHLFKLKNERNQLYQQKKSYINFEGVLTMVSLIWLLSRQTYQAVNTLRN